MKYYETLYIAHPILETGRLKDTIENIQNLIEKNETNSILCTEVWGKKKLAYPIEKQKYGTYILVQYSGDGHMIDNVNKELEHNVNILAYMTVEIDKNEIREQKSGIESQILGSVNNDFDNKREKKDLKSEEKQNNIETKEEEKEEAKEEAIKESTEESSEESTEEAKEEMAEEVTEKK